MWAPVIGADTLAAGFSHVFVQAAEVCTVCYWPNGTPDEPPQEGPSAEEALAGILRHAPPALRTCTLAFSPLADKRKQTRHLELAAQYRTRHRFWDDELHTDFCPRDRDKSFYETATILAKQLRPFAREASIKLRVDTQSQEVHFVRTAGIS